MKLTIKIFSFLFILLMMACGGKEKKKEGFSYERKKTESTQQTTTPAANKSNTSAINLTNKGVGPITSITLSPEIDEGLAAKGQETFKAMCTACHKVGKKFIGPAPNGIMERRSPEWVMNMILNPEGMVKEDPIAKNLLMEYNGAPMANQNLTEEQARAVLEYFRTLK
ncbi:cytochrome c [Leptobacterium sp. I13]|uniref:c-type cytochrome n=1 Tax=Leptobacterium meishanense TaxID=3128904 RepID=UPI0030EC2E6D